MTVEIEPFRAISVSRLAHELKAQGRSIIHMEFGQPSTGAPKAAQRVAERLADCADDFLGAVIREAVWLDRRDPITAAATPALARLAASQLLSPESANDLGRTPPRAAAAGSSMPAPTQAP